MGLFRITYGLFGLTLGLRIWDERNDMLMGSFWDDLQVRWHYITGSVGLHYGFVGFKLRVRWVYITGSLGLYYGDRERWRMCGRRTEGKASSVSPLPVCVLPPPPPARTNVTCLYRPFVCVTCAYTPFLRVRCPYMPFLCVTVTAHSRKHVRIYAYHFFCSRSACTQAYRCQFWVSIWAYRSLERPLK